jgi:outer membrane protein assembly factor BamA
VLKQRSPNLPSNLPQGELHGTSINKKPIHKSPPAGDLGGESGRNEGVEFRPHYALLRYAFAWVVLLTVCGPLFAATDLLTIDTVLIYGNRHTSDKIIRHYLHIDKGIAFDSTLIEPAKKRLMSTSLFNKVEIFPQYTINGVRVMVVLSERFSWSLTGYGGELYSTVYGQKTSTWWNVHGGVANSNFRGKMEQFSLSLSFPRRLSVNLAWTKPFVESAYYLKLGSGISFIPDLYIPWDRFSLYGYATLGRKFDNDSRIYASLMPAYGRHWYRGGPGYWVPDSTHTYTSPFNETSPFTNTTYDVSGYDIRLDSFTVQKNTPTPDEDTLYSLTRRYWGGHNSQSIAAQEIPYRQLTFLLGWSINRCQTDFDISRGTAFGVTMMTNALFPRNPVYTYLQIDTDTRLYRPGFWSNHKFAARLRTTFRVDSADIYDAIWAGGETSLRGYSRGWLPRHSLANNQVLATGEYRFPIWTTPKFDYPILSDFIGGFKQFYLRLDGALFCDAAYLWHSLLEPQNREQGSGGVGAGAGLRLLAPTLQLSGGADAAWGFDGEWIEVKRKYVADQKSKDKFVMPWWFPELYLYFGMMF